MRFLRALLEFIKRLFGVKPPQPPPEPPPVPPPPPPPLVLPHPEESRDDTQTVDTVNIDATLDKWLTDWQVPQENWDYWKHQIVITIDPNFVAPAGAWTQNGKRHLTARPEWFNPGVVAHEQAHNSYALLSDTEKLSFDSAYASLRDTDAMIVLMRQLHPYADTNNVEAHAEVYRYIGLPESLRIYYPKLW